MTQLRYTKTHEWLKQQDELVLVGITDHAQQLLGDLVFVELPEIGESFNAGDELGVVESVKAAADFYSPVSGMVMEVNQHVSEDPSLVNTDPYEGGWLVKIKPSNPEELNSLLSKDDYEKEIAEDH